MIQAWDEDDDETKPLQISDGDDDDFGINSDEDSETGFRWDDDLEAGPEGDEDDFTDWDTDHGGREAYDQAGWQHRGRAVRFAD
jgi:hypothetical protein